MILSDSDNNLWSNIAAIIIFSLLGKRKDGLKVMNWLAQDDISDNLLNVKYKIMWLKSLPKLFKIKTEETFIHLEDRCN